MENNSTIWWVLGIAVLLLLIIIGIWLAKRAKSSKEATSTPRPRPTTSSTSPGTDSRPSAGRTDRAAGDLDRDRDDDRVDGDRNGERVDDGRDERGSGLGAAATGAGAIGAGGAAYGGRDDVDERGTAQPGAAAPAQREDRLTGGQDAPADGFADDSNAPTAAQQGAGSDSDRDFFGEDDDVRSPDGPDHGTADNRFTDDGIADDRTADNRFIDDGIADDRTADTRFADDTDVSEAPTTAIPVVGDERGRHAAEGRDEPASGFGAGDDHQSAAGTTAPSGFVIRDERPSADESALEDTAAGPAGSGADAGLVRESTVEEPRPLERHETPTLDEPERAPGQISPLPLDQETPGAGGADAQQAGDDRFPADPGVNDPTASGPTDAPGLGRADTGRQSNVGWADQSPRDHDSRSAARTQAVPVVPAEPDPAAPLPPADAARPVASEPGWPGRTPDTAGSDSIERQDDATDTPDAIGADEPFARQQPGQGPVAEPFGTPVAGSDGGSDGIDHEAPTTAIPTAGRPGSDAAGRDATGLGAGTGQPGYTSPAGTDQSGGTAATAGQRLQELREQAKDRWTQPGKDGASPSDKFSQLRERVEGEVRNRVQNRQSGTDGTGGPGQGPTSGTTGNQSPADPPGQGQSAPGQQSGSGLRDRVEGEVRHRVEDGIRRFRNRGGSGSGRQ